MRQPIAFVVISLLSIWALWAVCPKHAHCSVCMQMMCIDSRNCGGHGCVCLKAPLEPTGECMSIE